MIKTSNKHNDIQVTFICSPSSLILSREQQAHCFLVRSRVERSVIALSEKPQTARCLQVLASLARSHWAWSLARASLLVASSCRSFLDVGATARPHPKGSLERLLPTSRAKWFSFEREPL